MGNGPTISIKMTPEGKNGAPQLGPTSLSYADCACWPTC